MSAPVPGRLVALAARYALAQKVETDAHARILAAEEEHRAATEAWHDAQDSANGARVELLTYAANGRTA